jgi:hypothetical protein
MRDRETASPELLSGANESPELISGPRRRRQTACKDCGRRGELTLVLRFRAEQALEAIFQISNTLFQVVNAFFCLFLSPFSPEGLGFRIGLALHC